MTHLIDIDDGLSAQQRDECMKRLRCIAAETRAMELVEALKAAVANAAGWQFQAQMLLHQIADGKLPEPA